MLIICSESKFLHTVIRAPKVPFNFHFKTEMEKDIFAHLNFNFKIEN